MCRSVSLTVTGHRDRVHAPQRLAAAPYSGKVTVTVTTVTGVAVTGVTVTGVTVTVVIVVPQCRGDDGRPGLEGRRIGI